MCTCIIHVHVHVHVQSCIYIYSVHVRALNLLVSSDFSNGSADDQLSKHAVILFQTPHEAERHSIEIGR